MENKTREQLITEKRNELIKKAVKDGFYYFEVGKMFKMTEGRISQILKVAPSSKSIKRNK